MNKVIPSVFVLALILLSCNADDDSIPTSLTNGPPLWVENYPQVASGAVSVDLNMKTDRPCNVYYILSSEPMVLSPAEVIAKSKDPSDPAIRASGVVEITSADETRETIDLLFQNTQYYSYLVAQNIGDSLYLPGTQEFDFKTVYKQDTIEYLSNVEKRNVAALVYQPEEALKYPLGKYPVCYFLGSKDEVSTESQPLSLIRNGTLPEYLYLGNDVPAIVISAQHVDPNWSTAFIEEIVTYGNANFSVDTDKVYLTGIGEGGTACWNFVKSYPGTIAAMVPVSGSSTVADACSFNSVAIWAFHNEIDYIYSASSTTDMITAVNGCSPTAEVTSLIFPDPGHDCWRRVYDKYHDDWSKSPGVERFDIFEWLVSKSK